MHFFHYYKMCMYDTVVLDSLDNSHVAHQALWQPRVIEAALLCSVQFYAMPCNAMLCNVMPCYAMPCNAMLCYVMQCYAMPFNAMPRWWKPINRGVYRISTRTSLDHTISTISCFWRKYWDIRKPTETSGRCFEMIMRQSDWSHTIQSHLILAEPIWSDPNQ